MTPLEVPVVVVCVALFAVQGVGPRADAVHVVVCVRRRVAPSVCQREQIAIRVVSEGRLTR